MKKILLFMCLIILFSCNKLKTPPKNKCIEPYVGNYKVIELRKNDGTIISEQKIKDSLHADQCWFERHEINQQSAPYDQIGWYYSVKWSVFEQNRQVYYSKNINECDGNINTITTRFPTSFDSINYPFEVEFFSGKVTIEKQNDIYTGSNSFNSSQFKMIKQ